MIHSIRKMLKKQVHPMLRPYASAPMLPPYAICVNILDFVVTSSKKHK